MAGFCGFDLPPRAPEGGNFWFFSPWIREQGQLHRGAQQIFAAFPEEGFPIRVPFGVADPLPIPWKGNSVDDFLWKELTHVRDPTDLSEGKAQVGFQNLNFKGSGST